MSMKRVITTGPGLMYPSKVVHHFVVDDAFITLVQCDKQGETETAAQ